MPTTEGRQRLLVAVGLVSASFGIALQGRINGALVATTGNALEVGVLNIAAGLILGTVLMVGSAQGRRSWHRMIAAARGGELRWWEFLGGIGGIALVTLQSAAVAVIGVAAFTVALVAGQTTSGAVIDRFGLATGQRTLLTRARVGAMVLAVVAVALSAAGRIGTSPAESAAGSAALLLVVLSVVGGGASSVQATLNGRVARAAQQPIVAAWVSFVVAGAIGVLLLALLGWTGVLNLRPLPIDRPWMLVGGTLGLLYVMAAAWAVRPLGLLVTAILTVVGSLGGALVIDVVAPVPGVTVSWHIVAGTALALLAAGLSALGRRAPAARPTSRP